MVEFNYIFHFNIKENTSKHSRGLYKQQRKKYLLAKHRYSIITCVIHNKSKAVLRIHRIYIFNRIDELNGWIKFYCSKLSFLIKNNYN